MKGDLYGDPTNGIVTSLNWARQKRVLMYRPTGELVPVGSVFHVRREGTELEMYHIVGGRAPHKPSSSGRIYVKHNLSEDYSRELFPHVLDMEWIPEPEATA